MLEIDRVGKRFPNGQRGAEPGQPARRRRRDRRRGRRQRLRQEHAAAPGGRPGRRPTEGRILLDGSALTGPSPKVGVVFQEPRLMPWLTAHRTMSRSACRATCRGASASGVAEAELARVGLARFADALPKTLSGGMAQRAALARALVTRPPVLLLDEPFSAARRADAPVAAGGAAARSGREDRPTMLLVTHDLDEALFLADRVVVLGGQPGPHPARPHGAPAPAAAARRRGPGRPARAAVRRAAARAGRSGTGRLIEAAASNSRETRRHERRTAARAAGAAQVALPATSPEAAVITLRAKGEIGQDEPRLPGRDRPGAGRGRAASGHRRQRAAGLLRRHAAGGAGRLRRRDAVGGGDGARASRSARARSSAEGDLDFRGTLGVAKDAPVGFRAIRLRFALDTDADDEQLATPAQAHRALLRRAADRCARRPRPRPP